MSENAVEVSVPVVGASTRKALRKKFKTNSHSPSLPALPLGGCPLGHDGGLRAGNGPVFLEGAHAGEGQRGDVAQRERNAAVVGNGLEKEEGGSYTPAAHDTHSKYQTKKM